MSKKFRESLSSLSPDEIAEKVGEYCEMAGRYLTDRQSGTLRTLFNTGALYLREHANDLVHVAAAKNGVEYAGHDDTLEAIADAVEARGSQAASKIRSYVQLLDKCKKAGAEMGMNDTSNPFKLMRIAVQASKQFG